MQIFIYHAHGNEKQKCFISLFFQIRPGAFHYYNREYFPIYYKQGGQDSCVDQLLITRP